MMKVAKCQWTSMILIQALLILLVPIEIHSLKPPSTPARLQYSSIAYGDFELIPTNTTCSDDTLISMTCKPHKAEFVYWTIDDTMVESRQVNNIWYLHLPCKTSVIRCVYSLNATWYSSPQVNIIQLNFMFHPEETTCNRSTSHSVIFTCIPTNSGFSKIYWLVNGTELDGHTKPAKGSQLALQCSQNYNNTSVQCIVKYHEVKMESETAVLKIQG